MKPQVLDILIAPIVDKNLRIPYPFFFSDFLRKTRIFLSLHGTLSAANARKLFFLILYFKNMNQIEGYKIL